MVLKASNMCVSLQNGNREIGDVENSALRISAAIAFPATPEAPIACKSLKRWREGVCDRLCRDGWRAGQPADRRGLWRRRVPGARGGGRRVRFSLVHDG